MKLGWLRGFWEIIIFFIRFLKLLFREGGRERDIDGPWGMCPEGELNQQPFNAGWHPMEPHQAGFIILEEKKWKSSASRRFLSSWGLKQRTWWGGWTYWGQQRTQAVKTLRTTLPQNLSWDKSSLSLPPTKYPNVGYWWLFLRWVRMGLRQGSGEGSPLLHFSLYDQT